MRARRSGPSKKNRLYPRLVLKLGECTSSSQHRSPQLKSQKSKEALVRAPQDPPHTRYTRRMRQVFIHLPGANSGPSLVHSSRRCRLSRQGSPARNPIAKQRCMNGHCFWCMKKLVALHRWKGGRVAFLSLLRLKTRGSPTTTALTRATSATERRKGRTLVTEEDEGVTLAQGGGLSGSGHEGGHGEPPGGSGGEG